ncbi:hypothetical protein B0H11DRAFT_1909007 [Mycena galericulata]|nr:hypothetical protein B0H11DRAFT_1909007 [Mycena galericulata]
MSDPPEYDDDELSNLIASLSDLDLASLQQSPPPAPPPRTPSPRQTTPVSTPRRTRVHQSYYQYHSPTKSGRTSDWSEAAHYSQGVPGASVHRVFKSSEVSSPKPGAYAVFYGRGPGTYSRWSGPDGAAVQVTGVSGALHQGYPTAEEADAAFQYALTHGWTGQRPSPTNFILAPIPSLPIPVSPSVSSHNPLHGQAGCTDRKCLECALNTLSLRGAAHDSTHSRAEAERRWESAVADGRVRVLTPPYFA